ncbi:BQ2448_3148 [Microbotryum intermedium]|uniref:BQ2448_3148 protein n=1 Tax=Microbotryum intermedium TaxID=269621 RepID=A0A238FCK1_9BASI|nr:BQ2448_3148 [Microbotryum intermedium]
MSGELASQLGSSDPASTTTPIPAAATTGTGQPAFSSATETATAPAADSPMSNITSLKADTQLNLATTHEATAPAAQPTPIEAQPYQRGAAASIEPTPAAEVAPPGASVFTAADIPAEPPMSTLASTAAEAAPAPSEAVASTIVEPTTDAAIPQPPVSDLRTEVEAEAPPAEIVAASEADSSTAGAAPVEPASDQPLSNGTIANPPVSTVEPPLVNGHEHPNGSTSHHELSPISTAPPAEVASSISSAPIVPPAPLSAPETIPPPPVVPLPAVTEFLQMPQIRRAESSSSSIAAQPATPVTSTSTAPPLPSSAAVDSPAPTPVSAAPLANDSYDAFVHEQFGFDPTAAAPASSTAPEPMQTESVASSEPNVSTPAPAPVPAPELTHAPASASAPAPTSTPVNAEPPASGDAFAPSSPAPAPIKPTPTASSEDVQMTDSSANAVESPLLKRSFSDDSPAVAAGVASEDSQERDAKRFKSNETATTPAAVTAPATASSSDSLAAPAVPEAARVPSPTPQPVLGYDPSAFTHVASLPHSVVSQASAHNSSTATAPTHSHQPQFPTSSATPLPTQPEPAPVPSPSGHAHAHSPAPEVPTSATAIGPLPIMTKEQQKWALMMIRSLKKNKSAGPFCRPVDPVALLIPDYFRVITRPMDLGTIETKLNATGKAMAAASKVGRTFGIDYTRGAGAWEGASDKVYRTADEFKEDVMRVWDNCYRYNGPADKNPVSAMAAVLQEICERQWKTMPSAPLVEYVEPPAPPRPAALQPVAVSPMDGGASKKDRRPSQSFVPTIRRSEDGTRPKREIHAPTRELPYLVDAAEQQQIAAAPGRSRTGRVSGKTAQEQLRFCKEVIKEMFKKVHEPYAYVFYEPVNYVVLNIPQYPQIIKKPMDLGTVRNKLEQGLYNANPYSAFEADMRLIFKNCYTFNPVGSPVNEWGHRVEQIFEQKWNERPMAPVDDEDEVSEDDGISAMEKQLQMMQANLELMKQQKRAEKEQARMMAAMQEMQAGFTRAPKPSKKQSAQERRPSTGAAPKRARNSSTGGAAAAPSTAGASKKKRSKHREEDPGYGAPSPPPAQPESVTFEMKRELAVKIVSFEGENLERAIDIIRRGRPDLLSDANKEIELDIDQLDQCTLLNLYRFVCPPAPKPKQARRANGASAAPSKRKLLDEDKEAERIEALEKRLLDFQKGTSGSGNPASHDVASSESSSDDDSGSDSDED